MAAIATAKTDEILNVATEAWAAIEQN